MMKKNTDNSNNTINSNSVNQIKTFMKKEIVLVISFILALISCFFVPINKKYISYIDFRVLALLICLMLIVEGLRRIGFFDILSNKLFLFAHTTRQASFVFVMMCFFGSMIITNDVSLILFVPFSIYTLKSKINSRSLIFLIVLETIAANLGSMLTPIGNPQNLYLYSKYHFTITSFIRTMLPYTLLSFVLLVLCCLFISKDKVDSKVVSTKSNISTGDSNTKTVISNVSNIDSNASTESSYKLQYFCYGALFILVLTTIAHITPYYITFGVCVFVIAIINAKLFSKVDYALIFTFVFFFILVGNIKQIPAINTFITDIVAGNELSTSIVASQFISNVPAAILLSSFTDKAKLLLVGVNIGGLGTMIASMASLISFKFYSREKGSKTLSYFLWFTLFNVVFLLLLIVLFLILNYFFATSIHFN